ncbi:MAG: cation:proton antiporter, partial [Candidatus Binataceae bacterium]
MVVVLFACRTVGALFLKIGQPRVNGEMAAGILLGPSLLGWVAPPVSAYLFPASSLEFLNALSQIGVIFFMFLVGLGMNLGELRSQGRAAVATTFSSILAPFALAFLLALYLYPRLSTPEVSFYTFAEFLGAGMSITAFPMLARMLSERNMLTTRVGTIAVTCAAASGVASWSILAYIAAHLRAGQSSGLLWLTFGGIVAFAILMIYAGGPLLQKFENYYTKRGSLSESATGLIVLLVMVGGMCAGYLGIHPLFGAFMVGAVMPKGRVFVAYVSARLETVAVAVLLPLFFAFSGLRTNVGLVQGTMMWLYCGLIILTATAAKLGSSTLSTWACGVSLRESAGVGALLNTRGLITLIVLNIGLDMKVITPTVFSMMVVMALVTTVMT